MFRNNKLFFTIFFPAIFFVIGVFNVYGEEKDANEIMLNNYNIDHGNDYKAEFTMELIKRNGQKRKRKITSWFLEKGEEDKNLIKFELPASEKGTGFLSWAHGVKDDDQWLFLPALKRTRRIAGTEKDKSFMGTDFSYNDMRQPHPKFFVNNLIGEEVVNGIDCYKLENIHKTYLENATSSKNEKYQYAKVISWISKENFVLVKSEMYDRKGKICKKYSALEIKKISGYWVPVQSQMENLQNMHKTILTITDITFNLNLAEDFFSQQQLSRTL